MKRLTYNEIKEISFGALSTFEKDGIHFYKCTSEQSASWNAISTELGERSLTTSGVRLDFITNSKIFRFDVNNGNKFEVLIDGLQRKQFFMNKIHEKGLCAEIELDAGDKRITLVFPSHEKGVISFVEIEEGATIKKVSYEKKILFLGDSITQGWASEYDSLSYAWRTGLFYNADFIIQGIGGACYNKSTFDLKIPFDADEVIIAYGINDCYSSNELSKIEEEIKGFIGNVKKRFDNKRIVVITPIWCSELINPVFADKFRKISKMIESIALGMSCELVNGMSLVPHIPEMYEDKSVHPNDNGFGIYAENLIKALNM